MTERFGIFQNGSFPTPTSGNPQKFVIYSLGFPALVLIPEGVSELVNYYSLYLLTVLSNFGGSNLL